MMREILPWLMFGGGFLLSIWVVARVVREPKGTRYPELSDEDDWYYYEAPR